jgi:hypothetical protein
MHAEFSAPCCANSVDADVQVPKESLWKNVNLDEWK